MARRKGALEDEMIFVSRRHRIEFHHLQAKDISQIVRVASIRGDPILIDQARVKSGDERAPILNIQFKQIGFPTGQQMQRWCDHQLVFGQVLRWAGKVHRNIPVVQRVVEKLNVLTKSEDPVRLHRLVKRPVVIV